MGILTFLQHKEATVAEPPAKNTSVFIAESTEGSGVNEVIAGRPAIRAGASFFRFVMADDLRILGTSLPEGVKEETEANSETGIKPSTTKCAFVWVGIKAAEAITTSWAAQVGGKTTAEVVTVPHVGDIIPLGTFYVPPNTTIKLTKTSGKISGGLFSVQLMN